MKRKNIRFIATLRFNFQKRHSQEMYLQKKNKVCILMNTKLIIAHDFRRK